MKQIETMSDLWNCDFWDRGAVIAAIYRHIGRPGEGKRAGGSPFVKGCPGCERSSGPQHGLMTIAEFLKFHPRSKRWLVAALLLA